MWDGYVKSAFLYLQAYFGQSTSGEERFGNKDQNFLIEVQQTVVFLMIHML
jgi:hypothetical protein